MNFLAKIIDKPIDILARNSLTRGMISYVRQDQLLKSGLLAIATPLIFQKAVDAGGSMKYGLEQKYHDVMTFANQQIEKHTLPRIEPQAQDNSPELKDGIPVKLMYDNKSEYINVARDKIPQGKFFYGDVKARPATEEEMKIGWSKDDWLEKKKHKSITQNDLDRYMEKALSTQPGLGTSEKALGNNLKYWRKVDYAMSTSKGLLKDNSSYFSFNNYKPGHVRKKINAIEQKLFRSKAK